MDAGAEPEPRLVPVVVRLPAVRVDGQGHAGLAASAGGVRRLRRPAGASPVVIFRRLAMLVRALAACLRRMKGIQ